MGDRAVIRACQEMYAAHVREEWDDVEIVGTPAQYWLGDRRVAAQTVDLALFCLLFQVEGLGTDYERYTLNERGKECGKTGKIPSFILSRLNKDFKQDTMTGGSGEGGNINFNEEKGNASK